MKLKRLLRQSWAWFPPHTWPEIFAAIITLEIAVLALAYLIHHLKGALP